MTLLSLSKPRHADLAAVYRVCAEQASECLGLKNIHHGYRVIHIEIKQLFTCELVEDF